MFKNKKHVWLLGFCWIGFVSSSSPSLAWEASSERPTEGRGFYRCMLAAFSAGMLWFEQGSSRANVLSSRSLSSATKGLVTASVTASLLHSLHVIIHHSAQEGLRCACGDARNVQDADNTRMVYYFDLPSLKVVFPHLCTLHEWAVSLLDNLLFSVHTLSSRVFII